MTAANTSAWVAAAAKAASNSTAASEATAEGRPAGSVAANAESKQAIDFDCCWVTAACRSHLAPRSEEGSCSAASVAETSETSADMSRWRSLAARTFDRVTGAATGGHAPEDTEVVAARKRRTTGKPETGDGFAATAWAAIAHCISEVSRKKGCCKDCCRSTMRPGRSPRPLSAARLRSPPADSEENGPRATPAAIPEKNWTPTH